MIWQQAVTTSSSSTALFEGGFSLGTLLLVIGMFLSLAVVSSLGILARMRDRSAQRRAPRVNPETNSTLNDATSAG